MSDDTKTLDDTIDTHLAGYCEPDRARRIELLSRAWAPDGMLTDPPLAGAGIDAIADLVDAVLAHFPEHRFVRTTVVDAHHGFARYGWSLIGRDGAVAISGTDVAEVGADGKLVRIVGFFGDLAPLEQAGRR